jgi:hypothetical protein
VLALLLLQRCQHLAASALAWQLLQRQQQLAAQQLALVGAAAMLELLLISLLSSTWWEACAWTLPR